MRNGFEKDAHKQNEETIADLKGLIHDGIQNIVPLAEQLKKE